jgi:condensin complex subunit 1
MPNSALEKENSSPQKKGTAAEEQDELDLIGGTTEDDFTEAMAHIRFVHFAHFSKITNRFHIRERELLYGENSLLSNFGPLVAEICGNNGMYKVRNSQHTGQAP